MNTIADQYAEIKMQIEKLEEQLAPLKAEISSIAPKVGEKAGNGWKIDGDFFRVTISVQSRETINSDLLKEKFGLTQEQIDSCKKESIFDVIRYKAI